MKSTCRQRSGLQQRQEIQIIKQNYNKQFRIYGLIMQRIPMNEIRQKQVELESSNTSDIGRKIS